MARHFLAVFGGKVDPSLKSAAASAKGEISGVGTAADEMGTKAGRGSKVLSGALGVAKGAAVGLGVAAGAAGVGLAKLTGGALSRGFDRLDSIDKARGTLQGLGHDAKSVENIMGNALAAVKGTAFGLGDAATVAASTVAAGVKPGKDLERTLKLVGDAATIGQTSMGEMGAIFNKVAASNKIQMGEMNQLMDRGIPVQELLAKQLGVTQGEVAKLASAGKIDFATFQAAMEKGMGGAALKSGETFSGALDNVRAAQGRLGAAFLEPAFAQMPGFFNRLIPIIDRLAPVFTRAGEATGNLVNAALPKIEAGLDWLVGVIERNQESFFRWGETAGRVLGNIGDVAKGVFKIFAEGDFDGTLFSGAGIEEDHPLIGVLFAIREGVISLKDLDLSGLGASFTNFGTSIATAFGGDGVDPAAASAKLQEAVDGASRVVGWLADNSDKLAKAIPFVVGGLIAFRGATIAANAANQMFGQQSAWRTAALFASAGASLANTLATRAATTATVQDTTATNVNAAAKGRATLATKLAAGAQRVLNLVMRANPIGLIITAITLLVGGLVLAYQKSETFRNIVNGIGTAIMSVVRPAIDWFTGTALPALGAFTTWVGQQFLKLWPIIKTAFDIAVAVVTDFIGRISQYFQGGFAVLTGIFDFFKNLFTGNWSGLRDSVLQIAGGLWTMLGAVFGSGRDRALGFVLGLRDRAVTAVTNMRDWVIERVQGLRNGVVEKVTGLRDGAVAIFEGLRDKATELGKAMADQFGREVDSLRSKAAAPIKFVIETVMNNGIIAGYNKVAADIFNLPRIPNIPLGPLAAYESGGRANRVPGSRSRGVDSTLAVSSAGVPIARVDPGEGIVRYRSMQSLDRKHPGAFDYINRFGRLPGLFRGGTMPTPGPVRPHRLPYYSAQYAADMGYGTGSPVYAWRDGRVAQTMYANTSYGNRIRLNHDPGQTLYAHLSQILVAAGQAVRAGQLIGRIGYSGNVRPPGPGGAHLHFEILGGAAQMSGDTGDTGGAGFFDGVKSFLDNITAPMRRLSEITDTPFGKMAAAVPERIKTAMEEKIRSAMDVFGAASDAISGAVAGGSWQGNANLLMQAGRSLGASRLAMKIALMTAAQESSMGTNRTAMSRPNRDGDTGWFQQRLTRGDGSQSQLADPLYALRVFLHGVRVPAGYHVPGLYNIRGWQGMRLGDAAQRVQVSAYPRAYDKWERQAEGWLTSFGYDSGGWLPPGIRLTNNQTGKPEAVLTNDQWTALFDRLDRVASALEAVETDGGDVILTLDGREVARIARAEIRNASKRQVDAA